MVCRYAEPKRWSHRINGLKTVPKRAPETSQHPYFYRLIQTTTNFPLPILTQTNDSVRLPIPSTLPTNIS